MKISAMERFRLREELKSSGFLNWLTIGGWVILLPGLILIVYSMLDVYEYMHFNPEISEKTARWQCLVWPGITILITMGVVFAFIKAAKRSRRIAHDLLTVTFATQDTFSKDKIEKARKDIRDYFYNSSDAYYNDGIPDMTDFTSSLAGKRFLRQFKTFEEREHALNILKEKGIIGSWYSPFERVFRGKNS